ncbi:hypothetical protein M3Y99_00725100 [Aphelenchoides fujianensis]|nr:hypothetical protein M3Y99_00725100 [Aphelenchoides fujianensis]
MLAFHWTFGLLGFAAVVGAFSFSEKKWKFLLPKDTMKELFDLDANSTRDPVGVDREIDRILRNQSRHLLDQLDLPPYYEQLPFVQRWQIKDVLFDKQLSYQQKLEMIHDVIRKLPVAQQRFANFDSTVAPLPHSRYFEAFSTLQYRVNFNFKLSELKRVLSEGDMRAILHAIGSPQLDVDEKTAAVDRVMAAQPFEVLDRLFFAGVPIVDAEVRERFRRLFLERGFWMTPNGEGNNPVAVRPARIHPPCVLKQSGDAKHLPPCAEEADEKPTPVQPPTIVIEVQTGGADGKDDSPMISASSNQPTALIVDGKPVVINESFGGAEGLAAVRTSRIEVVVQSQPITPKAPNKPSGAQNDEPVVAGRGQNAGTPAVPKSPPPSAAIPWNLPTAGLNGPRPAAPAGWRPPKFEGAKNPKGRSNNKELPPQPPAAFSGNSGATTPIVPPFTRPSRWSTSGGARGPWTPRDEREFLLRW